MEVEFRVVESPKTNPYIIRKGRKATLVYELTQEEMDEQMDNLFN